MSIPITLTEAVCAGLLCLYAISTSRGADPAVPPIGAEPYGPAQARAESAYRSAQETCEGMLLLRERDLCFRQAKASYIRQIVEADMLADGRARN